MLADKAYAADDRIIKKFISKMMYLVIPSRVNNLLKVHDYIDKELYKSRQLIESFFAKLKQYRAIATRCD